MPDTQTKDRLETHIDELGRVAREVRGVPDDIVREAAALTMATFRDRRDGPRTLRARSESYFWRVVSRRLVKRQPASSATARFIVATVVEDLVATGRDPMAVWRELERGWADKVPGDVLEEYRVRLCA